jgi:4-hydroxy-3-polyprenylbenzoate decarboxylase
MMHAFWGVGQMSFVKHAIFVGDNAPELTDHEAIIEHILNRLNLEEILVSRGVIDALDHSSPKFAVGGKLGLDCTGQEVEELGITLLSDEELLERMHDISDEVKNLKQYFTHTKNPICVISVEKTRNQKYLFEELTPLFDHIKILIIVDDAKNSVENPYMLVWRVTNNIDSNRDLYTHGHTLCLDATNKNSHDNFKRRWPDDVDCTKEVIESLKERGIIEVDEALEKQFRLCE